jgi:light-regulated signal transduction histidine kinase (bacteriophytochrome)
MRRTILSVQRLTAIEQASLHVQPVAMGQCVGRALASLEPVIRESGALIEIAEMPTLVADESLIATLLENLVANALKFSSRPVKVNITVDGGIKRQHFWRSCRQREQPSARMQYALYSSF